MKLLKFIDLRRGASKVFITLISRVSAAVIGIIFVPIYIKLLGVESYGLIAFFGTLSGSLMILDLGLSLAISRKLAMKKVDGSDPQESKDLFFSVELIYWSIALVVGLSIILLAGPIARHWVNSEKLDLSTIKRSVQLMGLIFAFQWPLSIYNGALIGLERQITSACVAILLSVVKAAGVIVVLMYVSPDIETYFIWQVFVTIFFAVILKLCVRLSLPRTKKKMRFSIQQLKAIWRFSAGVTGISLVTFFLSQVDKIVVSKIVVLEYVGYYTLAFTVAGLLTQIISPMQPVVFPKFSALAAKGDNIGLIRLYHKCCRWTSILILPLGLGMIFFSKEILLLWTHNPKLTAETAPIIRVFAAGTICNCLVLMPYFLMLAKGITRYTIYQNLIAGIVLVPLLFWWTEKFGILGASYVWLVVNASYVVISIPLIHRFYIQGQLLKWYLDDFFHVLIIALAVVGSIKIGRDYFIQHELSISQLFLLGVFGLIIYVLLIRETRTMLIQFIKMGANSKGRRSI